MVNAGPISSSSRATVTCGTCSDGRPCGIPPKARADRRHAFEMAKALHGRGDDQRHQRTRHALETRQSVGEQHETERKDGKQRRSRTELRQRLQQRPHLFMEMFAARGAKAEKFLPLADEDNDGDTRGEAHDHGVGNETNDPTHFRETQ